MWAQAKPAQGKWQECIGGGQKERWDCFCQQQRAVKLTPGGRWWAASPKRVSGGVKVNNCLQERDWAWKDGQDRKSQGAKGLVQGKETARWDWIQIQGNWMGWTEL